MSFSLDPETYDSDGQIDFKDVHIDKIPEELFPPTPFSVSRFTSDLHLVFKTKGSEAIWGNIRGSISDSLIHAIDRDPVALSCDDFSGSFEFSENKSQVILENVTVPFADLEGKFYWDRNQPVASLLI